jgi:Flp pilus assembly protein TadD
MSAMTRFLPAVLALFLIALTAPAGAQTSSKAPQDVYLQIYLQIQEAERLENSGQKLTAKNRYQASLERLTELQKSSPQWEPTIVKYRMKYCQDKIAALADARDATPAVAADPEPSSELPVKDPIKEPVKTPVQDPEKTPAPKVPEVTEVTPPAPDGTLKVPVVAPEIPPPAPVVPPTPPVETPSAETVELKKKVQDLQEELASTKQKLDTAVAEAAQLKSLSEDLKKQLAEARKGSSEQMDKLLDENKSLKEKLADANTQVEKLQKGEKSVANLEEQVTKLKDQLETSQKQNEELVRANEGYRKQLEETQKTIAESTQKLATLEKDSKTSGPLVEENKVLRDIIDRQLKEQARRDAAKRLALEEITALNIQSTTLQSQVQILGTPLVELTAKERAMLKIPVAEVKEVKEPKESKEAKVDDTTGGISAPLAASAGIDSKPRIPEEFRDVAEQAQKLFAQRKFDEAAAKYQIILNTYPNSLYALSNLGVVRFQQGNYPAAEKALRRAVELAPQDAFSHTILGISLYQQGKYDQAITVLQRAIALDPKDPKTRNYLGISLSQLGRQESAEQQCRKAIELDDTYGDAHFNLAVIYATQKPPAKELARRHYKRGLELGVPRDPQLEELLK